MIVWYVAGLALLAGGLLPAAWLGMRGGPVERLVGLELVAAVTTLLLLVLAQAGGQSSLLVVPLVLVVLSFAGTLVFTRLLRQDP
ncbi:monovalent cation/H+ antiporter complex subunit F [Pseudonocardia lutea]|uniref:Monovalent cation/H+ antiporter complex subunit F n=1 Tax=Pseudonocardia lutea TaxID=2172015 RepID=A0ABW1I7J1_9PSEU